VSCGCLRIWGDEARKSPAPLLFTLWLAMNPAINPKMIHAMKHMQPLAIKTLLDAHSFRRRREVNGTFDAKRFLGIRVPGLSGRDLRDTARYCRTRATASELLSFTFKGWGACSEQWNEHHDKQNDSRIGRGSDRHCRNNDECIRSTKKDHSINTKAVVRDVDRGHSELGCGKPCKCADLLVALVAKPPSNSAR